MKRVGVVLILILAFLGLADSTYIAQQEASGEPLICNIENLSGCNIVTTSEYSKLFGIPLAEYGILFYGILFVLVALELVISDRRLRRVIQVTSLIGIISSLYFIFVQKFFIGAFCIYCLASAVISFLIFICAGFIEPIRRDSKNSSDQVIPPKPPIRHLTMPPA